MKTAELKLLVAEKSKTCNKSNDNNTIWNKLILVLKRHLQMSSLKPLLLNAFYHFLLWASSAYWIVMIVFFSARFNIMIYWFLPAIKKLIYKKEICESIAFRILEIWIFYNQICWRFCSVSMVSEHSNKNLLVSGSISRQNSRNPRICGKV